MPDQLKQAIYIKLRPSYLLLSLLVLIAILSVVSISFISGGELLVLPGWFKWGMQLLIIFSTVYYILRDALLQLPWSWQSLVVNVKGGLTLTNQRGQTFMPTLAASTFIHPQLILLNFIKQPSQRQLPVCLLLRPSKDMQGYRQLRVWLKWWRFDESKTATMFDYHER